MSGRRLLRRHQSTRPSAVSWDRETRSERRQVDGGLQGREPVSEAVIDGAFRGSQRQQRVAAPHGRIHLHCRPARSGHPGGDVSAERRPP